MARKIGTTAFIGEYETKRGAEQAKNRQKHYPGKLFVRKVGNKYQLRSD